MGHYLVLVSSSPHFNAVVEGPDVSVRLHFNSRIDREHARLLLVGPEGIQQTLNVSSAASRDVLASEARKLKHGSYALEWQVRANGGQITRGQIPFCVGSQAI